MSWLRAHRHSSWKADLAEPEAIPVHGNATAPLPGLRREPVHAGGADDHQLRHAAWWRLFGRAAMPRRPPAGHCGRVDVARHQDRVESRPAVSRARDRRADGRYRAVLSNPHRRRALSQTFTLALVESDLPGGHSPGYFAVLNQPRAGYAVRVAQRPGQLPRLPEFFWRMSSRINGGDRRLAGGTITNSGSAKDSRSTSPLYTPATPR